MAIMWRCKKCKKSNSIGLSKCRNCGISVKEGASGYEVRVMIENVRINKFFRDYELARQIEIELKKKQELLKIKKKLKIAAPELAGLIEVDENEKGKWIKLKFFWGKYLKWLINHKKISTVKERIYRWKQRLYKHFGEKTLSQITPDLIFKYQEKMKDQGYTPVCINRDVAIIRHMLTMAVKWGYLKEHPIKGKIEMLREIPLRSWTFITREEYERIMENLSETYQDLYRFLVFTGARLGEALSLRWKDIIWEAGIAYLQDSKANRPRVIIFSDVVMNILERRKEKLNPSSEDRIFQHSDSEFRRAFKRALKIAGLPESIRIHDLRHTFASWLALKKVPLHQIKELLGHSQIATTLRYSHLNPETLKKALSVLHEGEERKDVHKNTEKIINFKEAAKRKKAPF